MDKDILNTELREVELLNKVVSGWLHTSREVGFVEGYVDLAEELSVVLEKRIKELKRRKELKIRSLGSIHSSDTLFKEDERFVQNMLRLRALVHDLKASSGDTTSSFPWDSPHYTTEGSSE